MSSSRPELWIFTDWDETITSKDTLALIAPPDSAEPGAPPPFSFFVDYYMQVSRDFEKSFGPRNTLQRQLEFLDSIKVVEKASVSKIEEYGLFRGVTNSDLCERAKQVTFREGWKEFTEKVMESEDAQLLAVLSVNWSAVFIECALRRIHDDAFIKQIEIRANNVQMDPEGRGTGMLTKAEDDGICTGHDKLREMKKIIEKRTKLGVVLTVYVGDSNTDLPCLLHADIGILIGDGRSVLETCERLGIWVESGRSMKDMSRKARADKKEQILYHFENWHSIINSGILD